MINAPPTMGSRLGKRKPARLAIQTGVYEKRSPAVIDRPRTLSTITLNMGHLQDVANR
jgi:hypothetical protein